MFTRLYTMGILLFLYLALPALGADVEQRISGGSNALIGNFPHQLSLRESGIHVCGASLISNTRAVTSAYCVGSAMGVYTVLGGTADRIVTNCDTCVLRELNLLVKHPQYNENGNGRPNDAAVIGFLAVNYNENLQAITMAEQSDGNFIGVSCIITGWGRDNPDDDLQTNLQQGEVTAMNNTDCEVTWGTFQIDSGHLCTYATGVTACSGDEGSPLVCRNKLAGMASWGEENCDAVYPYVFTRISEFIDWLIEQ